MRKLSHLPAASPTGAPRCPVSPLPPPSPGSGFPQSPRGARTQGLPVISFSKKGWMASPCLDLSATASFSSCPQHTGGRGGRPRYIPAGGRSRERQAQCCLQGGGGAEQNTKGFSTCGCVRGEQI